MKGGKLMADLTWEGNSKAMFDKCIEGSPKPFRAMTEKKLLEAIEKRAGDSKKVTEDIIIEAVKEITPKPFLPMALKAIEPLKSS
jgi:hypothetical protein